MKKIALFVTISIAMAGCATQTFQINPNATSSALTKEEEQSFFVRGVGQTQIIDAAKICGDAGKIAKVEAHYTPLDGFFEFLTFGIYAPRAARVYCEN